MAIKVKAVERQLKVGKDAGNYRFMLQAEIYNTLSAQKVISEAAVRSGIPEGALSAAWDAIGQVVKVWNGLITTRRVIFSPSTEIKDELLNTSINITCYDRDGKIIKRVTSTDPGTIEDPEDPTNSNSENQNQNNTQPSGDVPGEGD